MPRLLCQYLLSLLLLSFVACRGPAEPNPSQVDRNSATAPSASALQDAASFDLNNRTMTIAGPYTWANLQIYLLLSDQRDDQPFISLQQGLADNTVIVQEQDQATVDTLMIENRSDKPLFLQEGDRVKGGKQDRTIFTSMVVPPNSKPIPLPAFCVEQSRWTMSNDGRQFKATRNSQYAPQSVRYAAKYSGSQYQVWEQVSQFKQAATTQLGTGNRNSSINEALDNKALTDRLQACGEHLGPLAQQHPTSIGMVVVTNHRIVEADIYLGHQLFAQVYPHLLQSLATDAIVNKTNQPTTRPAMTQPKIRQWLTRKRVTEDHHRKKVNDDNTMVLDFYKDHTARSVTLYRNTPVHIQIMANVDQLASPVEQAGIQDMNNTGRQIRRQIQRQQINTPAQIHQAIERPDTQPAERSSR